MANPSTTFSFALDTFAVSNPSITSSIWLNTFAVSNPTITDSIELASFAAYGNDPAFNPIAWSFAFATGSGTPSGSGGGSSFVAPGSAPAAPNVDAAVRLTTADVSVTGTSGEANGSVIKVYKYDGVVTYTLIGTTTVSAGVFTATTSALVGGTYVVATVTAGVATSAYSASVPVHYKTPSITVPAILATTIAGTMSGDASAGRILRVLTSSANGAIVGDVWTYGIAPVVAGQLITAKTGKSSSNSVGIFDSAIEAITIPGATTIVDPPFPPGDDWAYGRKTP